MNKFFGVAMVLFALVLAVAPAFTDCESHGKMLTAADGRTVSMKCHWAGVAEVAAAVPLALAGVYSLRASRKETTRFAGLLGVASAAVAIMLPTLLIGVCANPMMICNLLMRPILVASGILAGLSGLAIVVIVREPEIKVVGVAA